MPLTLTRNIGEAMCCIDTRTPDTYWTVVVGGIRAGYAHLVVVNAHGHIVPVAGGVEHPQGAVLIFAAGEIQVLLEGIERGRVRLRIDAPPAIRIFRGESV